MADSDETDDNSLRLPSPFCYGKWLKVKRETKFALKEESFWSQSLELTNRMMDENVVMRSEQWVKQLLICVFPLLWLLFLFSPLHIFLVSFLPFSFFVSVSVSSFSFSVFFLWSFFFSSLSCFLSLFVYFLFVTFFVLLLYVFLSSAPFLPSSFSFCHSLWVKATRKARHV